MIDLAQDLAAAVERECNILQFREDHEARNERIDALMLKDVSDARKRIQQARKAEADETARIDAEIAALMARKAEVQSGTLAKVEAAQRRIDKARAYLAAGE